MAAHSMPPARAPITTSDSISADLDYLHHVGEEERKGCAKRRASATDSISRAAGIQRRGLYVQAIEFAAVNPPVWQVTLSRTSAKGRKQKFKHGAIAGSDASKV